jgi:inner membrane transporter RhtA
VDPGVLRPPAVTERRSSPTAWPARPHAAQQGGRYCPVRLAALNVTFFAAIDRIEMGIAVSLGFVAPLTLALATSRRRHDMYYAALATAGVIVLGGLDRPRSTGGVILAFAAGCAWVAVAYAGRMVGSRTPRIDGLALALPVSAALTLPFGAHHAAALDTHAVALGIVIAVVGLVVPFALELEGLRRLEPRVVAVVYSVDPAVAALVGFLALGQRLGAPQILALIAVVSASIGVTVSTSQHHRRGA